MKFWFKTFLLTGLTPYRIRKLFFILTSKIDLEEPTFIGDEFYLTAYGSHVMIDTPGMRLAINHSSQSLAIQILDSSDPSNSWVEVYRHGTKEKIYKIQTKGSWLPITRRLPKIVRLARRYRKTTPRKLRITRLGGN